MVITLWEEKAYQYLAALAESEAGPLFVVITGLLAKKFSGKPEELVLIPMSFCSYTQMYLNNYNAQMFISLVQLHKITHTV